MLPEFGVIFTSGDISLVGNSELRLCIHYKITLYPNLSIVYLEGHCFFIKKSQYHFITPCPDEVIQRVPFGAILIDVANLKANP
jgi:hypothetical protein